MKKFKQRIQEGFTLVEILIVVVIIGILATVAIPTYFSYVEKAYASDAKTQLKNILMNAKLYAQQTGDFPDEVDQMIEEIKEENGFSDEELIHALKSQSSSIQQLRKNLKRRRLVKKVMVRDSAIPVSRSYHNVISASSALSVATLKRVHAVIRFGGKNSACSRTLCILPIRLASR